MPDHDQLAGQPLTPLSLSCCPHLLQVMQLGSKFQKYSVQRASQVACRLQPQFDKYLDIAQAHTQVLDAAVADLEAKADTTHKQKADGESFRGGHAS